MHRSGDEVLRKTVDRYLALRGSTFDFWRWSVTNHLWNGLAEVEGEGRVVNVNRLAQGGGRLVGRGGKVYQVRAPSESNLSLILAGSRRTIDSSICRSRPYHVNRMYMSVYCSAQFFEEVGGGSGERGRSTKSGDTEVLINGDAQYSKEPIPLRHAAAGVVLDTTTTGWLGPQMGNGSLARHPGAHTVLQVHT